MGQRFTVPFDLGASDSWWDHYGFALPDQIAGAAPAAELISERLTLVIGEPWIGKSYVSQTLHRTLSDRSTRFVERVSLEEGDHTVLPHWWTPWRNSSEEAWWIIDALDEALHVSHVSLSDVFTPLLALGPQERNRLHVIAFSPTTSPSRLSSSGLRIVVECTPQYVVSCPSTQMKPHGSSKHQKGSTAS